MYSDSHEFIYVHVPKTGGTSVENALKDTNLIWTGFDRKHMSFKQHMTCSEMLERGYIDEVDFDMMFKFAFVRNPWDRIVSEYMWRIKRFGNFVAGNLNKSVFGESHTTPAQVRDITFKQFLKRDFYWKEVSFEQHMKPQTDYLMVDNKVVVNYVGRFERFNDDFSTVCGCIGVDVELPHINKTSHTHYSLYYEDDESVEIVRDMYTVDIDKFGYEFEDRR